MNIVILIMLAILVLMVWVTINDYVKSQKEKMHDKETNEDIWESAYSAVRKFYENEEDPEGKEILEKTIKHLDALRSFNFPPPLYVIYDDHDGAKQFYSTIEYHSDTSFFTIDIDENGTDTFIGFRK